MTETVLTGKVPMDARIPAIRGKIRKLLAG
jgi:hypothetical protein